MPFGETIASAGLGMLLGNYHDARQREQQERLQRIQIQGQKEMGKFNQELAMQMWERTNFAAQRKQMEKAGLNVGLMYQHGGPGGTTQTPTGNVTGGTAAGMTGEIGMGIQLGLQAQMQKAQIELAQATAQKTKVEAAKIAGVDTQQAQTTIQSIIQNTANAAVQNELMQYEKDLKEIETNIAKETQWQLIRQAQFQTEKMIGEAIKAQNDGKISQETADTLIQQIKTASTEQALRIATQKAGLIKTAADTNAVNMSINKMAAEIVNLAASREIKWMEIDQAEKERFVREKLLKLEEQKTNFNTSTAAQVRQWTSIITDIVGAARGTAAAPMHTIK